jgi:hypothetical protein
MTWDVTSDVQDFADGIKTNYGWIIRDTTPYGGPGIPCTRFRTKEYGSYMPYLEVHWSSTVHTVCPSGTPDFFTIQAAINAAANGDTIELCDTTFAGAGNRDLDYLGKSIYIRSASRDPSRCTIDCGGTPMTPHRGFYFHSGEDSNSVLEGITITNGYSRSTIPGGPASDAGGGVYIGNSSSPSFINCIFYENQAVTGWGSFGGGVMCESGCSPSFSGCRFLDNIAFDDGGGLADFGGATLVSCTFESNTTQQGHGGGMTVMGGDAYLDRCTFYDNGAGVGEGGGLSAFASSSDLDSCIFRENSAALSGGAVLLGNFSSFTFERCTFYGNSAPQGSGLSITWNSDADIENTIISFGTAGGEGIYCAAACTATLNCCDVYGNAGGDWVGCIAGQAPPAQGNISADPLFCNAGLGDFHLRPTSPCAPANTPPGCGLIGALGVGCNQPIVCPDGSAPYTTIQAAINAAVNGSEIILCDTTFSGPGNRDLDFLGKSIYIRSESRDPSLCIIDCGGSPTTPHRGFYFHSAEDSTSAVEGITITNGYSQSTIPGGPPSDAGGAVYIDSSASPTFVNCVFEDNEAVIGWGSFGGAVCCESGCSPDFIECQFVTNTAFDDGGGLADFGDCTLKGCLFDANNSTQGHGGGMTSMGSGSILRACRFYENWSSANDGGGLSVFGCPGYLDSCIFWDNTASAQGGAVFLGNGCTSTVDQCTFYDNSAPVGGGIALWRSFADIDNTIISFSSMGEAVYCDTASAVTLDCCDLYGNAGGDWVGCTAGQAPPANGNISADPLFWDPDSGDFYLDPTSPCAPANSPPGCGLIGALGVHPSSGMRDPGDRPEEFHLSQSVPNPFSATSEIRYSLPVACRVSLVIHDVTGRTVRTLVLAHQESGHKTARWDGRNDLGRPVSNGVYFYRLEAARYTETKKMVLIR